MQIGFQVLPVATDVPTGLQLFIEHSPDICIIDTDQDSNGLSGLELAEKIRVRDSAALIIFLTYNYTEEEYIQVRHVHPSGFMSKELSSFKLRHTIELALLGKISGITPNDEWFPSLPEKPPGLSSRHYFFKIDDHYVKIPIDGISFFFAKDGLNYARVNSRNFPINVLLKALEKELQPIFIRLHKTYLVNINFIDQINPKDDTINIAGETLPIGYTYRRRFLKQVKLLK